MSQPVEQNLENHGRTDPPFHFLILGILATNFLVWTVHIFFSHSLLDAWQIVLAIGLIVLAFKVRLYSLKVQDRVIRLEERLRLSTLLPEPLRMRIPELTEGQLVALRFAPDAEVALIVDTTLREKLSQKQIKELIQTWRPDYWRV